MKHQLTLLNPIPGLGVEFIGIWDSRYGGPTATSIQFTAEGKEHTVTIIVPWSNIIALVQILPQSKELS